MDNNDTTASVVSRITDEEIEGIAKDMDVALPGVNYHFTDGVPEKISAVLRDYVRMRRENCELRKCLKETKEIVCDDCETENCETCTRNMRWHNLLAEAETKGEK